MTYQRFEDLPVWNAAIALAEGCEDFITSAKEHLSWSKRDQLDRASLSVSNNISEGFERGTTNELLNFLYISRGSAGEVRSMLCYFERRPTLENFRSQISNLKSQAESCSRQLRAWADSLQNSPIKGQRHLNNAERQRQNRQKKAHDFLEKLHNSLPDGHPAKKSPQRPL